MLGSQKSRQSTPYQEKRIYLLPLLTLKVQITHHSSMDTLHSQHMKLITHRSIVCLFFFNSLETRYSSESLPCLKQSFPLNLAYLPSSRHPSSKPLLAQLPPSLCRRNHTSSTMSNCVLHQARGLNYQVLDHWPSPHLLHHLYPAAPFPCGPVIQFS